MLATSTRKAASSAVVPGRDTNYSSTLRQPTGCWLVWSCANCKLPVLRTYWYDGAKRGIPTQAQQAVASLPNVKLRLGRINFQNQQKGVDALIYRDLMTLARERAICEAFLLAGDEDLREGVRAAQDQGVRVTVIGIPPAQRANQSEELRMEADENLSLDRAQLSPLFALTRVPSVPSARAVQAVNTVSADASGRHDRRRKTIRGQLASEGDGHRDCCPQGTSSSHTGDA